MKNNRNNYIGKMRKGFKQKLSLLMIACLLFTGFHGLTISGRAETPQKEQNNEIEVNGSQVKVQLLGEDLRRAATEAILKGEKLGKSNLLSYSKDQDLATEFEEYFDGEKEIYPIPLNSISENLEECLAEEEAGLQIYVERDAKNLERLVRQESKESLLLYSRESAVAKLLPRAEEKTSVEKEEKASDSELIRDTELSGSELITFVYENKSEQKMTFQLSVDGNRYPKVSVAPKASLFKQFLGDAKKAQAEAKKNEGKEEKKEQASVSATEESKVEEKEAVAELKASEEAKQEESKEASDVELVSTAAEEHKEETQSVEAKEEKPESTEEKKEETVAESEAEKAEATAESTQAEEKQSESKAKESKTEDKSLLKEITENSEEFLPELQSVRFTQYSLNELGRKSQNVEIEGFGNVQVFYEEAAFEGKDVVLEAKRLFKPDEEVEGEKLTEEQVNILKEKSLYEDSASLDIRFVDRKDNAVEVEPKSPVSVRITIEKKALPEEAKAENISIHHIVEEKGNETPAYVETVSRSDSDKKLEKQELLKEKSDGLDVSLGIKAEENAVESTDIISKEFTVSSFSAYVVHWKDRTKDSDDTRLRFHYVDQAFNEIAPTIHADQNWINDGNERTLFTWTGEDKDDIVSYQSIGNKLHKNFYGYGFYGVYAQYTEGTWDKPQDAVHDYQAKVLELTNKRMDLSFNTIQKDGSRIKSEKSPYTLGKDCAYKDIYFIYKVCRNAQNYNRDKFIEPSLIHDKYITKNNEEEYELTLTGEVKRGNTETKPQPVDIVFVYDNTANISEENAKVVKESVNKLIDNISSMKNSYDPRYALVTMDGEDFNTYNSNYIVSYDRSRFKRDKHNLTEEEKRNLTLEDKIMLIDETIQGHDINGALGNWDSKAKKVQGLNNNALWSSGYSIKDQISKTQYNDSRNNYAFTSDKEKVKGKIQNLTPSTSNQTGANYYAAMRNVQALVQTWDEVKGTEREKKLPPNNRLGVFDNKSNFDPESIKKDNSHLVRDEDVKVNGKPRENAKKVVIFIAGGDPTRTYVKYDGVYEDYIKTSEGEYYLTRAKYQAGDSIGNGKTIYYPALNDARAVLGKMINIDAFYSVGIGPESNWSHLNELAMGKTFEQRYRERNPILPTGIDYKLYKGTTVDAIKNSFTDLQNKIASAQVQNVVIKDTLSKYVELIDGKNSVEGKLYKKSGLGLLKDTEIKKENWPALGLTDIKAKPTVVDGKTVLTLETVPKDFVLRPGYEIRLIAKVKPTSDAYKDISYPNLRKEGQPRTDLNDIYEKDGFDKVDDKGQTLNPEKYSTSVKKMGLYTNDGATISYEYKKPNDPTPKTPTEEYNKPIIHVKEKDTGYLKVYKGFVGFGYQLYDEQKQEWTELGKHVLKNVEFDIKRKLPNGQEELITTVNLGDDRWINGPITTSLQYGLKDGAILKINPVVVEKDDKDKPIIKSVKKDDPTTYHGYRFGFEIDNLPKNTQYQVVERVLNKDTTFTVGAVKYKYQENEEHRRRSSLTEAFNNLPFDVNSDPHGNSYAFNNFYEVTENPNVDLKVKKVVKELGVDAFTEEAKNRKFDFYLALYHDVNENGINIRKSYSEAELKKVVEGFNTNLIPSKVEVVFVKDIQRELDGRVAPNAPEPDHYAIHFQLHNGQTANFSLKAGIKYRVYEKKDADYDTPRITRLEDGKTIEDSCDVFGNDHVWYTCTDYKKNVGELITYYNPKKLPVPTGIVRDITPYLFGIFGFIAMAGAYFAINKKRREA